MNKNVMIGLVVLVLVLGGLGFWYYSSQSGQPAGSTDQAGTANDAASGGMMRSSMMELIASGKSLSCGFDRADASGSQRGTVYVSGRQMRGDFTIGQTDGNSFDSHMISDGEWLYTWGGPLGAMTGIKMRAADTQADGDTQAQADGERVSLDQAMDFNCQPWRMEAAMFAPPANVTFQEFTVPVMPPASNSNTSVDADASVPSAQCGACDQLGDEASRSQCRAALGCS